jgi:hypothetical protein
MSANDENCGTRYDPNMSCLFTHSDADPPCSVSLLSLEFNNDFDDGTCNNTECSDKKKKKQKKNKKKQQKKKHTHKAEL